MMCLSNLPCLFTLLFAQKIQSWSVLVETALLRPMAQSCHHYSTKFNIVNTKMSCRLSETEIVLHVKPNAAVRYVTCNDKPVPTGFLTICHHCRSHCHRVVEYRYLLHRYSAIRCSVRHSVSACSGH